MNVRFLVGLTVIAIGSAGCYLLQNPGSKQKKARAKQWEKAAATTPIACPEDSYPDKTLSAQAHQSLDLLMKERNEELIHTRTKSEPRSTTKDGIVSQHVEFYGCYRVTKEAKDYRANGPNCWVRRFFADRQSAGGTWTGWKVWSSDGPYTIEAPLKGCSAEAPVTQAGP